MGILGWSCGSCCGVGRGWLCCDFFEVDGVFFCVFVWVCYGNDGVVGVIGEDVELEFFMVVVVWVVDVCFLG